MSFFSGENNYEGGQTEMTLKNDYHHQRHQFSLSVPKVFGIQMKQILTDEFISVSTRYLSAIVTSSGRSQLITRLII